MAGNRVRINVFLDEGWLKKLQTMAVQDDRTVGEIVREAVRTLLKSQGIFEVKSSAEVNELLHSEAVNVDVVNPVVVDSNVVDVEPIEKVVDERGPITEYIKAE